MSNFHSASQFEIELKFDTCLEQYLTCDMHWKVLREDRGSIGDDIEVPPYEGLASFSWEETSHQASPLSETHFHPFLQYPKLSSFTSWANVLLHHWICFHNTKKLRKWEKSGEVKVVGPGWWSVGDGLAPAAADHCAAGERATSHRAMCNSCVSVTLVQ